MRYAFALLFVSSIATADCSAEFDNVMFQAMNYSKDVGILEVNTNFQFLSNGELKELTDRVQAIQQYVFANIPTFKQTCLK